MEELKEHGIGSLVIDKHFKELLLTFVDRCKDIGLDNIVFRNPSNHKIKYVLFRDGLTWILVTSQILANDLSKIREEVYLFEVGESKDNFAFLFSQIFEKGNSDAFSINS